nr:hypothetical protein [Tanacetum cinerariifolium]
MAKLTHAVNQQTSAVTTAMTAMLKQFQATPPPAPVKAVEEICVTYGGAHPYYQCLAVGGNTFPEFRDNIQGYVSAAAVNYNKDNPRSGSLSGNTVGNPKGKLKAFTTRSGLVTDGPTVPTPPKSVTLEEEECVEETYTDPDLADLLQINTVSTSGSGSLPSNTVANPKGELNAITTHNGLVTDGPTVPTHPKSITPEVDERVEETYTDPDLAEYTIKVPPPPVQKYKPPSQRESVLHKRDPLHPNIPYPSRMLKQKQQKKDEVQIQNFWQMFKQIHINITLVEALVLMQITKKCLKLSSPIRRNFKNWQTHL